MFPQNFLTRKSLQSPQKNMCFLFNSLCPLSSCSCYLNSSKGWGLRWETIKPSKSGNFLKPSKSENSLKPEPEVALRKSSQRVGGTKGLELDSTA